MQKTSRRAQQKPLVESVESLAFQYRNLLLEAVSKAVNKLLENPNKRNFIMDSLSADLIGLINRFGPQTFAEGLKEVGAELAPGEDFTADEQRVIRDWDKREKAAVPKFSRFVVDAWLEMDRSKMAKIQDRIALREQSLIALGSLGRAMGAENLNGTWIMDPAKENCPTCLRWNGKRHRLSFWIKRGLIPQQPGNENLECGGWECGCQIVSDGGIVLLPATGQGVV